MAQGACFRLGGDRLVIVFHCGFGIAAGEREPAEPGMPGGNSQRGLQGRGIKLLGGLGIAEIGEHPGQSQRNRQIAFAHLERPLQTRGRTLQVAFFLLHDRQVVGPAHLVLLDLLGGREAGLGGVEQALLEVEHAEFAPGFGARRDRSRLAQGRHLRLRGFDGRPGFRTYGRKIDLRRRGRHGREGRGGKEEPGRDQNAAKKSFEHKVPGSGGTAERPTGVARSQECGNEA